MFISGGMLKWFCVRDLVTVSVLHRTIIFIELSLYLGGLYPLQA